MKKERMYRASIFFAVFTFGFGIALLCVSWFVFGFIALILSALCSIVVMCINSRHNELCEKEAEDLLDLWVDVGGDLSLFNWERVLNFCYIKGFKVEFQNGRLVVRERRVAYEQEERAPSFFDSGAVTSYTLREVKISERLALKEYAEALISFVFLYLKKKNSHELANTLSSFRERRANLISEHDAGYSSPNEPFDLDSSL